jgi:pimeloyl-ACP methyl ester carboxylesterase
MSEPLRADSRSEEPIFFASGSERLFGVVTAPTAEANGVGVVLMTARGTYQRNRLSVRLARQLARHGYHVLRFDFRGVGESSGEADFELDRPLIDDVRGAVSVLEARGLERFILVGSCFGARSALAAAKDVGALAGLVLAVMPFAESRALPAPSRRGALARVALLVRRALADPGSLEVLARVVGAGLRRRLKRLAPAAEVPAERSDRLESEVEGWLEQLVRRKVPVLLLFGAEDFAYQGFQEALEGWPQQLRADVEQLVDMRIASQQNIHGRTSIEAQDWLVEVVDDWLARRAEAIDA